MKQYTGSIYRKKVPVAIKLLLLLAFVLLFGWGIYLVREKLLKNANEMGMNLAESYAQEEENRIEVYSMLLSVGASSLKESLLKEASAEEIQQWMAEYSAQMEEVLGAFIIDPYAVIGGQIVAAEPWAGDEEYDYSSTQWYRRAQETVDRIVYTDVYEDAITQKKIVTLAKNVDGQGTVLAFDILMENFHIHKNKASLPEASIYMLFDSKDELMYMAGAEETAVELGEDYLNGLVEGIRQGDMASHDSMVTGPDGRGWSVYYYEMNNGWLSVISMPVSVILQDDWDSAIVALTVVCAVLSIISASIMISGYFNDKEAKRIAQTLQMLGDSYYAIYRVDLTNETYTAVKSSADVRKELGSSGTYQHLLDVVKEVVDQTTHEKFEENLSIENIRKLVRDGIYDFGGDYQRNFGGTYKWVNIQVLCNEGSKLNEVILAFREIDRDKRRELQQQTLLQNALAASKQTVQQKAMFFSNASHDMRTPLNAIIGLAKLARREENSREDVAEYLEKIEHSGRQLLTLVNDVLDMSRLEHGKGGVLDYTPMDILACVREAVSIFREQAREEQKNLEEEYQVEHKRVLCDGPRLNQIMNNLVSNALKYSHEGAKIRVSLKEVNHKTGHSKYQIEVSDTGIGMSEQFQERLFEPFAREVSFASRKVSGTGLGMPIVKTIVQQMSGEITVNSVLGEGTTFIITIPLQNLDEEKEETAERPAPAEEYSLEGKTLLLAEDNEINMEVAGECLRMMGAKVLEAWDGQEAVDVFLSHEPGRIDAVLMDMQMPVMDGCEAARTIRSLDREDAQTVRIIAVTANVFAEDIARTTEAGMNAHIAKPIDFQELQNVLRIYTSSAQTGGEDKN